MQAEQKDFPHDRPYSSTTCLNIKPMFATVSVLRHRRLFVEHIVKFVIVYLQPRWAVLLIVDKGVGETKVDGKFSTMEICPGTEGLSYSPFESRC